MSRRALPYVIGVSSLLFLGGQANAVPLVNNIQVYNSIILAEWSKAITTTGDPTAKLSGEVQDVRGSIDRVTAATQHAEDTLKDVNTYTLEKALKEAEEYQGQLKQALRKFDNGGTLDVLIQQTFKMFTSNRDRIMNDAKLSDERKQWLADEWNKQIGDLKLLVKELQDVRNQLARMMGTSEGDSRWIAELILLKQGERARNAIREMVKEMRALSDQLGAKELRVLTPAPPSF